MRDRTVEDTFYMFFTTRAFASGIPTVLAGTPVVSAYEDNSVTQITAGITLGVDHDSVVGLNLLTIAATSANGYEAGKDYSVVITTGTVGGVSVVGEVVGEFSLSLSAAAVDLANATDGLGAIKADTASTLVDTAAMQPLVAKIPLSDGTITWNATALGSINAECDTALSDYDGPTNTEMEARTLLAADYFDPAADTVARVTLVDTTTANTDMIGTDSAATATALAAVDSKLDSMSGATFSSSTDSLEAIRNRGDAAWVTGGGGSAPTVVEIREEMDSNSTQLAAIVADTNELQIDDVPGLIAALNNFDPATDAVANVTLVATTTTNTDMRGTDSAATASALAVVDAIIDAILADTNELQSDDIPGLIAALENITAGEVNAEIVDALSVDTYAEPGQGVPGATASIATKIGFVYKAWRNRHTQTSSEYVLYADNGTTEDQQSSLSDDGTTLNIGEKNTGA